MLAERTAGHGASGIVDVLDRVLDKRLSVAGDIRIAKDDRHFSPRSRNGVSDDLQKQIKDLARKIALLSAVPTARGRARKRA